MRKKKCFNNKIYMSILIAAMGIGLFGGGATLPGVDNVGTVQAAETETLVSYPVCENWLEPVQIVGEDGFSLNRYGASASEAKYDPRNVGGARLVSAVRNQGGYETCWAFALTAAAESNLIKRGYVDSSVDLSENHFAYFFYNRQTDSLGNTAGDSNNCKVSVINQYGDMAWAHNAGTLQGAVLALTTWAGLTTEAVSPYNLSGLVNPDKSLCYQHDYSVRDVYFYSYDINNYAASVSRIKQAIADHGAVATGIGMNLVSYDASGKPVSYSDYYNPKTGAYYYNEKTGNHAVTIVGWDDNYSRNNFGKIKPKNNGAWIIKNSYGTEIADKGFFYVSYEDASLAEMMSVEMVPLSGQYGNNYQYDGTGAPFIPQVRNSYGQTSTLPNGTKYANIFKAKAGGSYCEELKAVSICTFSANTNYVVDIYTGLTNAKKPTSGVKAVSTSGTFRDAGYQTVTLPKTVALVPGERFAVVVKLTGLASAALMGAECSVAANNGWISFQARGAENQSMIYYGNKWQDYYRAAGGNLRIKAFTDVIPVKPSIKLSGSKVGVSKGSSKTLSLRKNPANIYRKALSWSSSNKRVATVNSKGKVKALSYGTTTISATVMKGGKKAKLKCKLTVGPAKLKSFKVTGGAGKLTAKWKKSSGANGYTIYYSTSKDGGYKKLADIGKGSTTKYTKKKMKPGTYYVKMSPYVKQGKTKLYGSDTAVRTVTVR